MKKMIAFVMVLALVCTNVPANLHVQTGTETVYAAQETAINSEQDLIAMQNNPKGKYYLAKDITITKKLNMFPDYKDDNGDYRVDSFMGTLVPSIHSSASESRANPSSVSIMEVMATT